MSDGGSSIEDVAARLHMLRAWASFESQSGFARRNGFGISEWNHFESGRRWLTLLAANTLRRNWRVTLDWLYHGDRSGLSVEVSSSLPDLEAWRAEMGLPPLELLRLKRQDAERASASRSK